MAKPPPCRYSTAVSSSSAGRSASDGTPPALTGNTVTPSGSRRLCQERLVCGPQLLDVGVGRGDLQHRRPQRRHPVRELAADGLRGGDRLVEVTEQPPSPVQQRAAGDGQLDPVGRAAQQLAAEQTLQGADLAAQRRLGHVQPRRRAAEVELLGHGDERAQMPDLDAVGGLGEREHLSAHGDQYRRRNRKR